MTVMPDNRPCHVPISTTNDAAVARTMAGRDDRQAGANEQRTGGSRLPRKTDISDGRPRREARRRRRCRLTTTVDSRTTNGATRNQRAAAEMTFSRRESHRRVCCGNDSTASSIRPDAQTVKSNASPIRTLPQRGVGVAARREAERRREEQPASDPVHDERAAAIEIQETQHRRGDERAVRGEDAGQDRDWRGDGNAGQRVSSDEASGTGLRREHDRVRGDHESGEHRHPTPRRR